MVGRRERRSAIKNRLSLGACEGLITPRRFTYYKLFNWHEVLRKRPMTNELLVFSTELLQSVRHPRGATKVPRQCGRRG